MPELHAAGPSGLPAASAAGKDALALVSSQRRQERIDAAPGQVEIAPNQHLQKRFALLDAIDDGDAVHHAAGRAVPFRDDQAVASTHTTPWSAALYQCAEPEMS